MVTESDSHNFLLYIIYFLFIYTLFVALLINWAGNIYSADQDIPCCCSTQKFMVIIKKILLQTSLQIHIYSSCMKFSNKHIKHIYYFAYKHYVPIPSQPSWVNHPDIPTWILLVVKLLIMSILRQYNKIAFLWCGIVNLVPKSTILRTALFSLLCKF